MIKSRVRSTARHVALDGLSLSSSLTGRSERGLRRPHVALPYLHAVPMAEERRLRSWLERLLETYTMLSYSDAVAAVLDGPIDRPYAALSFDDGFLSNIRIGRILADYGVSGCFFVPTGFIGTKTVEEARRFFGFAQGVDEPAMTWDDLEELLSLGHEVGNHTVTHRVISDLAPAEALDEIEDAARTLRSRLGTCEHFAWPRGRFFHFTDAAARAVFASGHLSCASAERGAHVVPSRSSTTSLCLRRDHEMTRWPERHMMYFLARSASRSTASSNGWPESWRVEDGSCESS